MAIVNRIVSSLHNNNIVPGYMNAYRKGFGTLDGIITLKCFIENSRRFNRKLLLLSWDFSQAFDKCSQLLTQECLKILGFSNFVISALANLPTSAIAKLCVNFAKARFPMINCSSGWPQGLSSRAQCPWIQNKTFLKWGKRKKGFFHFKGNPQDQKWECKHE